MNKIFDIDKGILHNKNNGVVEDAAKSGLTGDITSTTTMNYFIRVL